MLKRVFLAAALLAAYSAPASAACFAGATAGPGFVGAQAGAGAALAAPPPVCIVTGGLIADFDPSLLVMTVAGTNNVSSWSDDVGRYTIVQATASRQPMLVPSAFRGQPGVEFNGTATATLINTSSNLLASGPLTVMAMVMPDGGTGATNTLFMFHTSSEGLPGVLGSGGLNRVTLSTSSSFSPPLVDSIPVATSWSYDSSYNLSVTQYGGQSQPLSLNPQDAPTGAAGFEIGNAQTWTDVPLNGKVLRLLVYNRILTAAERAQDAAAFDYLYYPHATTGEVKAGDYWDSVWPYPVTLGGKTTFAPNCQAVLKLAVPAGVSSVPVVLSTNEIAQGEDPSVAVFVDGAFDTAWTPTADNDLETFTLSLDGSAHAVEIWGSYQTLPTSHATAAGTYIQSIPSTVAITKPTVAARGVVIYGDSIAAGCCASLIPHTSWPAVLRQSLRASGVRVAVEATGGRTLMGDADGAAETDMFADVNALAEHLAALLALYHRQQLWVEMGFNDYVHANFTLATWTSTLGSLIDDVHALAPSAQIILQGFTPTSFDSTPNTNGDLPSAYDAAKASLAAARPSFCSYHSLHGVAPLSDFPGGVHPNDTGSALIAADIQAFLGP